MGKSRKTSHVITIINVAIDKNQAIGDINFSKFAMFCPSEALIVSEVDKSKSQTTKKIEAKKEVVKVNDNFPEEKQCCTIV